MGLRQARTPEGTPKSFSIRRRILALATVLLLAAAVVLIVFIRDYAERAADRAFDRLLAASALTIAGAVQVEVNIITPMDDSIDLGPLATKVANQVVDDLS